MADVKDRIVFPLYETAKIDKSVTTESRAEQGLLGVIGWSKWRVTA